MISYFISFLSIFYISLSISSRRRLFHIFHICGCSLIAALAGYETLLLLCERFRSFSCRVMLHCGGVRFYIPSLRCGTEGIVKGDGGGGGSG
jgi:hypothetical protein